MAMHPMGMGRYYALAKYILPLCCKLSQGYGRSGSAALPASRGNIKCEVILDIIRMLITKHISPAT
jgi:hypothetical protein